MITGEYTEATDSLCCEDSCFTLLQLVESSGNAVNAKDRLMQNHSQRVVVVSNLLALFMGFSPRQTKR